MKHFITLLLLTGISIYGFGQPKGVTVSSKVTAPSFAQVEPVKKARYNVAIISPLYLDSFDLKKNLLNIPSYAVPGIDFYQGAKLAADSLNELGFKINLFVFDSKSKYMPISTMIQLDKLDSIDVIIANAGGEDLKQLANFGKLHKVNVLSAISPNDADQSNNGYFTMLQPKLATHLEKIQKHLWYNYSSANIIYVYRKNTTDTTAYKYFMNANTDKKITPKTIALGNNGGIDSTIQYQFQSGGENVIVLGMMDTKEAYNSLVVLNSIAAKGFNLKVFCMPNAENIKALQESGNFEMMAVYYTNALVAEKRLPQTTYINDSYKAKMGGIPSQNVYKSFDAMWYCANMLLKYGSPFNPYYQESSTNNFFSPYNLKMVSEGSTAKYYENKFLHMVKWRNGLMSFE
jgi:hypothetical protein